MEHVEIRGGRERFPDQGGRPDSAQLLGRVEQRGADGWKLLQVLLSGGAPWGFTLKGGREHGEPLIISKIEEGSKAGAADGLLVGDEIISINDVDLSGFRQEAICLVKGSHKTLKLIVKRKMKVVMDIVAQKMLSENDVHMARRFLTKTLRSSMRKNDLVCRPHSWHSTKFTEGPLETASSHLSSANVCPPWHSRYHSSSSSHDLSSWDQTNLQYTSHHFGSQESMDSLDHSSQTYQYGRLSSARSNNSIDRLVSQSAHDSAYGSFSTTSSTPDHTLSRNDAASTENMIYKAGRWDTAKHGNSKHSQFPTDNKLEDKQGYSPSHISYESRNQRPEDHSDAKISGCGRSNFGPVWHVPDKKKASYSPPPPTPPLRSDSFAATKGHEKTYGPVPPESTSTQHFTIFSKSPPKSEWSSDTSDYQQTLFRVSDRGSAEMKRVSSSVDRHNNNVSNTNRLQSSLSSTDVRFAQSAYGYHHQRQYSDESTFFHNAGISGSPKSQDMIFHGGIKEQSANRLHFYNPPQGRVPGAFPSANTTAEQNAESTGPSRYYCVTAKQPIQGITQSMHLKAEIRKAGTSDDMPSALPEKSTMTTVIQTPTCYLPQKYDKSSREGYEKNGYLKLEGGGGRSSAVEDFKNSNYVERTTARNEKRNAMCTENRDHQKDLNCNEQISKISLQTTPMLHSLSQEGRSRSDSFPATGRERLPSADALMSKQSRRNDRYATALRNEIQMRRARLQKSKSTAALTESSESEDHTGSWKLESSANVISPSDSSFTSTYKDHLKEAQVRVLGATSFKRRDLEPGVSNHPSVSPDSRIRTHVFSTSAFLSEDASGLPEPTQGKLNLSGSGSQPVMRIGGRKRFTAEQKLKSYSEPEKLNEVGISEDHHHHCANTSEEVLGSFADRWKFFEETSKSTHTKPAQKPSPANLHEERPERFVRKFHGHDAGDSWHERRARAASIGSENILGPQERAGDHFQATAKSAKPEQFRRLGTFAEYQASWKNQRKPLETRSSGRYHSADNILDAGLEEYAKPHCKHERSRSSPSTDYYAPDDSSGTRRRQTEGAREDQENTASEKSSPDTQNSPLRQSTFRHGTDDAGERGHDLDQNLGHGRSSSRPSQTGDPLVLEQESRARSGTLPSDYRYPPESKECILPSLICSEPHAVKDNRTCLQGRGEDSQWTDAVVSSNKRGTAPQRPPPPKLDNSIKYKRPDELASSPGTSSISLLTVPGRPPSHSPNADDDAAPGHPSITWSPAERINIQVQEPRQPGFLENEKQNLEKVHLTSESTLSLKHRFLQKSGLEMSRSPSPQFAPQKLTDKPPVYLQDENPARIEKVIGKNTMVKMVPIKIVHSESNAEKENRQNLLSNIEPPALPSGLEKDHIKTLSTSEQSYSRFCAYTRHNPEQDSESQSRAAGSHQANSPENILKDCNFSSLSVSYVKAKEKTLEDLKSEELAREIIGKDKSLADILDPNVKLKTAMDLMVGIFPKDDHFLEDAQQRRKFLAKVPSPKLAEENRKEEQSMPSAISLTTSSTYYSTSAPKAELLIKMKDMQQQQQQQQAEEDSEEELDHDLSEKKQELIDSISRKLQVLREARETLLEDIQANNVLGDEVEAIVKDVCKANEFDKFRMFIGDLDKVVNLLLSLSGRLARVENALNNLDGSASPEERRTLVEKQKLLTRQHEDAKELKENLDRRERIVFDILASYLSEENLADYEHFVKMKSALIIEQRELEDKIKLGEEQLKCLTDSLPLDRTKS